MAPEKKPDYEVDWFTISYRSIYVIAAVVVALLVGAGYYYFGRPSGPAPDAPSTTVATVTTARFTSLEGSVKVKTVGTLEWVNADKSMALKKQDLVRTGAGSSAEISFFDGTKVHVRPDSLITIEETSEDPATKRRRVAWKISSGEVNFSTPRERTPGSSTELSTPTLSATATDAAEGGVRVAESGDTAIKLFAGTAQAQTTAGQKIELRRNEALKTDAQGRAAPKIVLLEAPELVAPPHQSDVPHADTARETTRLAWKAVPGAAAYHVMLDASAYFNKPLLDRTGLRETSVDLRGLDLGKYYWRVAAVDAAGNEGSFSEFARFTVVQAAGARAAGAPPPVTIDTFELRGNLLQLKGRTEPGATVTVNQQRIDVQTDGSFNELITLDPKVERQTVVVRVTGRDGGVNEVKQQVRIGF